MQGFFGITNWPTDIVPYDLGAGRVVDVIPIPGHQTAHIALYDRQTGVLFTGDTLYPGRLYISNFPAYLASIQRLVDFTATRPVCHVLGTHIEMSNVPGDDFPIGSTYHPNEHPLPLGREHLLELLQGVIGMQASPHIEVHDEFIIWPF
jgi:hydroxyacylglutathione hydrolase